MLTITYALVVLCKPCAAVCGFRLRGGWLPPAGRVLQQLQLATMPAPKNAVRALRNFLSSALLNICLLHSLPVLIWARQTDRPSDPNFASNRRGALILRIRT